jgi:hypothetical protein
VVFYALEMTPCFALLTMNRVEARLTTLDVWGEDTEKLGSVVVLQARAYVSSECHADEQYAGHSRRR